MAEFKSYDAPEAPKPNLEYLNKPIIPDDHVEWTDQQQFDEAKERFDKTISKEHVEGGKIDVFTAVTDSTDLEKNKKSTAGKVLGVPSEEVINPEDVIVIDAKDKQIQVLSDLHLNPNPEEIETNKLILFRDYLLQHKNDLIILNGDVYETQLGAPAVVRKNINLGKSADATVNQKLFAEIHQLLREGDTVLLSGNHDPHEWYGNLGGEFAKIFDKKVIVKSGDKRLLVEHGNRTFRDVDDTVFGGIKNIPSPLVRGSLWKEKVSAHLDKDFYEKEYRNINEVLKVGAAQLKEIYGADRAVFGHSHLPEESADASIGGLFQHGRLDTLAIKNGEVSPEVLKWNDPYKEWIFYFRNKIYSLIGKSYRDVDNDMDKAA